MSVTKFKTIDEAIKKANNSSYGLTAGVCTTSLESMIEVSNALQAGQIFVNTWLATEGSTPFGGYKNSGIGREMGPDSLKNYTETKTVIVKKSENSLP